MLTYAGCGGGYRLTQQSILAALTTRAHPMLTYADSCNDLRTHPMLTYADVYWQL
jgi:hypothetical protein